MRATSPGAGCTCCWPSRTTWAHTPRRRRTPPSRQARSPHRSLRRGRRRRRRLPGRPRRRPRPHPRGPSLLTGEECAAWAVPVACSKSGTRWASSRVLNLTKTHFSVVSYAFSVTTPACERRAQLWPSFFLRSLSSALHTHFLSCVGRYAHQLRDLHGRCGPPHAPGMRHAGGSCAQVRLRLDRRTLPSSRLASPTSNQKAPRRRRRRYLTVAPLPP